jgi:hypothetical protein
MEEDFEMFEVVIHRPTRRRGTIVMQYSPTAFEVEFLDEEGYTTALETLTADVLERIPGMVYTCSVCRWPHLKRPPHDHQICPCCGTHFDYDDYGMTHAELREDWIAQGCPWFSRYTPAPEGWDAVAQLEVFKAVALQK